MATGKRPPSEIPGARRKRPARTIDLTATELASEPVAAPVGPEPPPQAASAPASEPPAPPAEPQRAAPEPPSPGGIAWLPADFPWPAAVAGALAAAAVMLVVLSIWLLLPRGGGDAVAALTPRLASIETQLRDLATRPAPAGVDAQAIEALTSRLAKLESVLNAPRPPAPVDPALSQRIGALENAIRPVADSIVALTRRADEADAAFRNVRSRIDTSAATLGDLQKAARTASSDHDEIAKLSDRIAALEKANRDLADQLSKSAAVAGSDRPVRLAMAAAALRAAVERGDAFTAELAAVKPLTSDASAIAAIEPFAGSGVPAAAALGRELLSALPVMQRAAGTVARDGGLLDRLQANAEKLVRVRPIEALPGEDVSAVLSRVEVSAAQGNIAGALTELARLQPSVRAPALAWIAKAEARNKALEASRRLATDALGALKTTP